MEKKIWYLSRGPQTEGVNLGPMCISHIKAEERKVFYHYTSVDALLKIAHDARLKFSRIDKVDDLMEKTPLTVADFYKRTYLACFSNNPTESIPLWKMYTNQGLGVRICFCFKDNKINETFLDTSRSIFNSNKSEIPFINLSLGLIKSGVYLAVQDVIYSNDAYTNSFIKIQDDKIDFSPDDFGLYKSEYWGFETETRLVLHVLSEDFENYDTDFMLVPINISALDHMEIRFDPWMSEEMKLCLKLTVNEFVKDWGIKIDYSNSDLTGKIR